MGNLKSIRSLRRGRPGLGRAGISLIEVMSAMVVLGVGALGLAPMMVTSIVTNLHAQDITQVSAAVQQELEARLATGIAGAMPIHEVKLYDNGKYSVVMDITDATVDNTVPAHVYKVSLAVNWLDDARVNRTMTFVSYAQKP